MAVGEEGAVRAWVERPPGGATALHGKVVDVLDEVVALVTRAVALRRTDKQGDLDARFVHMTLAPIELTGDPASICA